MPPPPPVLVKQETIDVDKQFNDENESKKKLETPLAAMLPSKYANVDVTDLFPDFRHGQVCKIIILRTKVTHDTIKITSRNTF